MLKSLTQTPFAMTVYISNIAAGGAQFICIVLLQRVLPREEFSTVSLVLSYFAPYLLLLELGIQTELVRRFSLAVKAQDSENEIQKVFNLAVSMRLLSSSIAIPLAALSAKLGGATWQTSGAVSVFLLCFLPASWLLTIEPLGFVLKDRNFASALRVARSVSLIIFLALALLNQLSFNVFANGALFFTIVLVFWIYLAIFIPKQFRQLLFLKRSHRVPFVEIFQFLKECSSLILGRIVNFGYGFLFLTWNLKMHGERELAEFNMANALVVPYTLLASVLMNQSLARVYSEEKSFTQEIFGFIGVSFTFLFIYAVFFHFTPVYLVFSELKIEELAFYLWPLAFSQVMNALISLFIQKSQNTPSHFIAIESPIVSLVLFTVTGPFVAEYMLPKYSGFWVASISAISLFYTAARIQNKRAKTL